MGQVEKDEKLKRKKLKPLWTHLFKEVATLKGHSHSFVSCSDLLGPKKCAHVRPTYTQNM